MYRRVFNCELGSNLTPAPYVESEYIVFGVTVFMGLAAQGQTISDTVT